MTRPFLFLLILTLFGCNNQELKDNDSNHIVPKSETEYWNYIFSPKDEQSNNELGQITFKRLRYIISESSKDSLFPYISFKIYDSAFSDSIHKLESERATGLSICYPRYGSMIVTTENFCFWSKPGDSECAFGCDPKDYTRPVVESIINQVEDSPKLTIEAFIDLLPIEGIKN